MLTKEQREILTKLLNRHPRDLMRRPMPPTTQMEELIGDDFMSYITRPDASDPNWKLVIGYQVTKKGEKALNREKSV